MRVSVTLNNRRIRRSTSPAPSVFLPICTKFGTLTPVNADGQTALLHATKEIAAANTRPMLSGFRNYFLSPATLSFWSILQKYRTETPYLICRTVRLREKRKLSLRVRSVEFVRFVHEYKLPNSRERNMSCFCINAL